MKSVMTHQFSQVPKATIERSTFDRSHGHKSTFNSGLLIPVFIDEALPGDTFNLNMSVFARMATPLKPVMDNLQLSSFFFAVPVRLLWSNFQAFMGEQLNPGSSTDFTVPQIKMPATTGALTGSLDDYFGIPVGVPDLYVNSLWHRAYNLVWQTWFKDQNILDEPYLNTGNGPDTYTYPLLRRGKRHDYFTSCLPFPQKGPDVPLPLGGLAPVQGIGMESIYEFPSSPTDLHDSALETVDYTPGKAFPATNSQLWVEQHPDDPLFPYIRANLELATGGTSINAFRQAMQLQRLYERDARGGTRYIELVKAHFGVTSPDLRATRPEFLGGGMTPISMHPVEQNTPTPASGTTTPQGNLAAFATVSGSGHGFTKSFTEHCILLGVICVDADLTYQQGLNRMFSRRTKYDFFFPALAHLGEQAVLNKEIFAQGSDDLAADEDTFGFQERFAEYRYKPSLITGQFRSTATSGTPLDVWHLAEEFDDLPVLESTFINSAPPVERVVAVPSEPQFLFDSYFKLKCSRPMPLYGVPGFVDHF